LVFVLFGWFLLLFILFYFILFYFILFYFIFLFYFILFYFILFYFILLLLFYFILFYFIFILFILFLFYLQNTIENGWNNLTIKNPETIKNDISYKETNEMINQKLKPIKIVDKMVILLISCI